MSKDEGSDSELGRSKQSTTPSDHLLHLLNIGWDPKSPLIFKYVQANNLERALSEWLNTRKLVKGGGS